MTDQNKIPKNSVKSEGLTSVKMDPQYGWKTDEIGPLKIYTIGRQKSLEKVIGLLATDLEPDLKLIRKKLSTLKGCYGLIVETKNWVLAAVDKIRGYPLFYSEQGTRMLFSNSARIIRDAEGNFDHDQISLIEFQMAGYVTGSNTLYNCVKQLQAGEVFLWDKNLVEKSKTRYFSFYSQDMLNTSIFDLIEELDVITDTIFKRIVEDTAYKNVWVPLSGGLDSRLVICKLKEHGCENLRAFSYGPPGNYEASAARHVAEVLKVPWVFVPDTKDISRNFFYSNIRKKYWKFADELHVVPNLHQICSLMHLIKSDKMKAGDIIINGQSGDFITGEHIPDLSGGYNEIELMNSIIAKHYNHRKDLLTQDNMDYIREKISVLINEHTKSTIESEQEFARQYELWEWQERQAKRVVHAQRNYDFLGLGWELPLWDCEYLEFWQRVPVAQKKKRCLFVDYVERMDFYGLFNGFKPRLSRWPGKRIIIQYFGNGLKLLMGSRISRFYYKRLDYFSQYEYLYAHLTYPQYLRLCGNYSPIAMYAKHWMKENLDPSLIQDIS